MLHQFSATDFSFISEQDDAHERRLKEAISVLLDLDATVTRAYLVRVHHGAAASDIVLGLLTHDKNGSGKLALQMDRAFGALFNTEAHLGVVFLDDEGDARIRKACPPFYDKRAVYH